MKKYFYIFILCLSLSTTAMANYSDTDLVIARGKTKCTAAWGKVIDTKLEEVAFKVHRITELGYGTIFVNLPEDRYQFAFADNKQKIVIVDNQNPDQVIPFGNITNKIVECWNSTLPNYDHQSEYYLDTLSNLVIDAEIGLSTDCSFYSNGTYVRTVTGIRGTVKIGNLEYPLKGGISAKFNYPTKKACKSAVKEYRTKKIFLRY